MFHVAGNGCYMEKIGPFGGDGLGHPDYRYLLIHMACNCWCLLSDNLEVQVLYLHNVSFLVLIEITV